MVKVALIEAGILYLNGWSDDCIDGHFNERLLPECVMITSIIIAIIRRKLIHSNEVSEC